MSIDITEYAVVKLKNVVDYDNLELPDWYDEKTGGYEYRWTNLTALKHNDSIIDDDDLQQVYYEGLGKKGCLGYIDGSYYDSCKDKQYRDDITNQKIEWKFEVTRFHKDYEVAEYSESYNLQKIKAKQSPLYYNGNNGFIKIIEGKVEEVQKLNDDVNEAIKYFMSLDIKEREGFYNGFEYKIVSISDIDKFIPYQLPNREEDTTVIDSVSADVLAANGDTSDIPPILCMYLRDGVLKDDNGKYLIGILNYAGNHRKKGCEDGGATRMGVLFIPEFRTIDFGEVEIQQKAMITNPEIKTPRNPTKDDEYISMIQKMVEDKNIPVNHLSVDNFLKGCGLKSAKIKKLKKLAQEKKDNDKNRMTPINWGSKGWTEQARKIEDWYTNDTDEACVGSVNSFNIEKLMNALDEAEEEGRPLHKFTYIMYGKNKMSWDMWDYEEKGKRSAKKLVSRTNKIIRDEDGKIISETEVNFVRLPAKHLSIGTSNKNFWDSAIGKDFLEEHKINLPVSEQSVEDSE